jgi:hypothetical protein
MVMGPETGTTGGESDLALQRAVGVTAAFFGGRALTKRKATALKTAERLRISPVALAGNRPALGFVGQLRF